MDSYTSLYGILGNPVSHSKSPLVHNACFKAYQINAIYLAFKIQDISAGIEAMKTLAIKGVSITLPFKESVMDHLDWIDHHARAIGSVNTVLNRNGRLLGFNTDYKAAVEPLKQFNIQGKKICIIGAGGAAKAVAYGLHKEKARLVIINRDTEKGERLAQQYSADFIPMDHLRAEMIPADMVINTTSIGMQPDDESLSFHLT